MDVGIPGGGSFIFGEADNEALMIIILIRSSETDLLVAGLDRYSLDLREVGLSRSREPLALTGLFPMR